ncbi:MAG: RNA polymerase sigma-70 factor [Prolixibacteraceae bacterium]
MINSDLLLIEKLKNGDNEAFDTLFREYYAKLVCFAQNFSIDQDDAKGIVQELFIKLWERRKQLSVKSSLKSYLYQSVRNACINYLNHQKVEVKRQARIQLPTKIEFIDQIETSELEHEIYQIIESLPVQCKKIFILSRFEDLKYSEIGEKLGISPRTVEVQIGRALKILKNKLKDHFVIILIIISLETLFVFL